jgi:hypothetical protein
MHSTSDPKQADPDGDVLVASLTEELEKAIARGPEPLSRVQEQVSKLERDAERYSLDQQIPVNTFRPTVPRDRSARRGLIGLLLAACIFVAAFALQSSYGDAVRPIIALWPLQLVPTSSQLLEKPGLSAQPSPASVQAAAAEPIPPQPTPSAQTAPQDIAPTTAPVSPEVAQLLQTIVRDLANLEQRIDQLKTGQDQMASDNAKAVERLKASQEEMARLIAKASERNPQPRISAPLPRPMAAPTPKPVPTRPSPQARAQPQTPVQLQPEDQ